MPKYYDQDCGNPIDSFHPWVWHLKIGPKAKKKKKKKWLESAENNTNELRLKFFHQQLALIMGFWKSGPNLSSDILIFNPGPFAPEISPNSAKGYYTFH